MSVYTTLDEGIASEIRVDDVAPRRRIIDGVAPHLLERPGKKPTPVRRASPANEPLPTTIRWVAALPSDVRPRLLLAQFPRIANRLARDWNDTAAFRDCIFDLLVDSRGNRRGFPPDVESELLALRSYFDEAHAHS